MEPCCRQCGKEDYVSYDIGMGKFDEKGWTCPACVEERKDHAVEISVYLALGMVSVFLVVVVVWLVVSLTDWGS